MGHKDKGDAGFHLQPLQFDLHRLTQFQIQGRQRFIQQQHFGLRGQGARQRHALLLAARKLAGLAVCHRIELDQCQHLGGARFHLGRRFAQHLKAKGNVLRHGQMRKERIGLEHRIHRPLVWRQIGDVLPIQQDHPIGGHLKPGNQAQQRGLATARWAKKRKELTLANLDRDIVQCPHGGVALAKGFHDIPGLNGVTLGHCDSLLVVLIISGPRFS